MQAGRSMSRQPAASPQQGATGTSTCRRVAAKKRTTMAGEPGPAGGASHRRRGRGRDEGGGPAFHRSFAVRFSANVPLRANRPCGRFWMKMMMNTSTDDLGDHGAGPAFQNLVTMPRPRRPRPRPASCPTPPSTTTMKESTM